MNKQVCVCVCDARMDEICPRLCCVNKENNEISINESKFSSHFQSVKDGMNCLRRRICEQSDR